MEKREPVFLNMLLKGLREMQHLTEIGLTILGIVTFSLAMVLARPAHAWGDTKDDEIVISAFGDSLTAGFMLAPKAAFPVQLEAALRQKGYKVRVLNAGVSGDTTSGGLERLDWAVPDEADAVIVELGINDAFRGIDPKFTRATLDKIITLLKDKGVKILLTGMEAPHGLGHEYGKAFANIFPTLAEKHGVLFYPFFVEGIALKPDYNLPDGIHPNEKGVAEIVKNILASVERLIEQVRVKKSSR